MYWLENVGDSNTQCYHLDYCIEIYEIKWYEYDPPLPTITLSTTPPPASYLS